MNQPFFRVLRQSVSCCRKFLHCWFYQKSLLIRNIKTEYFHSVIYMFFPVRTGTCCKNCQTFQNRTNSVFSSMANKSLDFTSRGTNRIFLLHPLTENSMRWGVFFVHFSTLDAKCWFFASILKGFPFFSPKLATFFHNFGQKPWHVDYSIYAYAFQYVFSTFSINSYQPCPKATWFLVINSTSANSRSKGDRV